MSFDIASNVAPLINEGAFMPFQRPDGAPLVNDKNEPVGAYLRARNSAAALRKIRENGNRRLAEASRGTTELTVERSEADTTAVLVACTVRFVGFDQLDGRPFTGSDEDARRFWSDDRFRRERERAEQWISNEANFMSVSPASSSNTGDTSSN
ncbi:MAG: hypothetical protein KGL39_03305 [Patescibacteria group bacterium]|nr:hypothetical protein [Patescibacteria group bacterium]